MKKALDFLQINFTGYYELMVFRWYIAFPKLAPLFTFSFIITFLGDIYSLFIVRVAGYMLLIISVFCFLMLRIFKKRQFNGLTKKN